MKCWLALALVACGCAGTQRTNGLCFEASAPDSPETWRGLLLYGYDPKTHQVATPALDCLGTPLFAQPLDADRCTEGGSSASQASAPLTDADVAVTALKDGRRLVWVQARRLVSGEAVGPVALIEPLGRGWSVRALGVLQALAQKPQLRLETTGGTTVLVAEGEKCDPQKPSLCARTARLVPLRGSRFIPEPLTALDGGCAGAAIFHLYRLEETRQSSGWRREYELSSTLSFAPQGIAVHEQLVVSDKDPKQGDSPPRVVRRAQSDRTVRAEAHRLIVEGDSLWLRVVPALRSP